MKIKDSPIEGKGLFTKVAIKKGDAIWISKGDAPAKEAIYTDEEFKAFQKWCLEHGKQWDAVLHGNGTHSAAISDRENHPEDYGNHSCNPNLDRNHMALRDIQAGEELTLDYAQFSTKDWKMKCNCGAKNCKGIVQGNL